MTNNYFTFNSVPGQRRGEPDPVEREESELGIRGVAAR